MFRSLAPTGFGLLSFLVLAVLGLSSDGPGQNQAPSLAEIANRTAGADPAGSLPFVPELLTIDAAAIDPNNDELVYSLPSLIGPAGSAQADLGAAIANTRDAQGRQIGRITIAPDAAAIGLWQLTVRVDDDQGGSDDQAVTLAVGTAANRSPVFSTAHPYLPDIFLAPGLALSVPVEAGDPDALQSVTLSARGLPLGAQFLPATGNPASSSLQWTPALGTSGHFTLFVDAIDDAAEAITETRRITIHVLDPSTSEVRIDAVIPNEGYASGGTNVNLFGQGFTITSDVIVGGNRVLNLTYVNSTLLTFTSPSLGSVLGDGIRDVQVSNFGSEDRLRGGFKYVATAPTITFGDVGPENQTAAPLRFFGWADGLVSWTIADEAGGSISGSWLLPVPPLLPPTPVDVSGLADGTLTVTASVADTTGRSGPTATKTVVKDTTAPALTLPTNISVVATNTTGEVVTYSASAHDARDGAVAIHCSPTSGSTFAPGTTTVTCSASDAFGNSASGSFTVSVNFSWSGVLPPVVEGGTYRLGRVLPIKFRLTGASAGITDLAATLTVAKISDGVGTTPIGGAAGAANGVQQFRYDASSDSYLFIFSTRGFGAGAWYLTITFTGGAQATLVITLAR